MTPTGSVVIAAHNEETVIRRCLDALMPAATLGVQIIVACNGCTDATSALARAYEGVSVIDLPVPSKVGALRAADRLAGAGPRIYLDADIVLTSRAALAVLNRLSGGPALAARPPISFDYSDASPLVRRWYRVRERLPSIQRALWGAGCYAMSAAGRARFVEFPDIVSDDLFVDSLFDDSEIEIVATDPVVVRTPRRVADLVKILRRTYRTQRDVAADNESVLVSTGQRGQVRDLVTLLRGDPRRVIDVATYVAIVGYGRIRAKLGKSAGWERDQSSRELAESS